MRATGRIVLVGLVWAGLLVTAPGIAEVIDSFESGCSANCPGDTADGDCGSACNACTCCRRAPTAVCVPRVPFDSPGGVQCAAPPDPDSCGLGFVQRIFHPPRS